MTNTKPHDQHVDLFTPITIGGVAVRNRIVMAPMTRNRADVGNVPNDSNAEYYRQRASAGLIVTEASQISPQGVGYPGTPGIHSDAQIAGWRKVTDAVHAAGGFIYIQLWHVGRVSHPSFHEHDALPVAPSSIRPAGEAFTHQGLKPFVTPRALETNEIHDIVEDFEIAAANAKRAGFDGVELHGANGYLIDQFLRDGSNHRTDKYGGSLPNRSRFLIEVIEAVSSVWDDGRIGVRLSPGNPFNDMSDSDPQTTFNYVVRTLSGLHLAYLHVVEMASEGSRFDFTQLRGHYDGIYVANGGYDFRRATEALQTKHADLISFGQLFLANPDLPARFRANATLNAADPGTFYGGDEKGYTDYPALEAA